MKRVLLSIFLLFTILVAQATTDTLVITDLSNEWLYYDQGDNTYLPLVEREKFEGRTLHFALSRSATGNDYLQIISRQQLSLLIDGKLWAVIENDTLALAMNEIFKDKSGDVPITLYSEFLNPNLIEAYILRLTDSLPSPLSDVPISYRRERSSFSDFFVVALMVLLAYAAALYNYFPRVFFEYLRFSRAFSFRETEENLLKSRALSQVNLFFYGFFCLFSSLLFFALIVLGDLHIPILGRIYFTNLAAGLWLWLKLGLVFMLWIFVKLILISNMTAIFQLGSFNANHFFNYIRILFIVLLVGLAFVILSYYTFESLNTIYYHRIFYLLLISMALTVIIIYLKLMNSFSFKKVHLFSYLCGTELVPYCIIVSLGISRAI